MKMLQKDLYPPDDSSEKFKTHKIAGTVTRGLCELIFDTGCRINFKLQIPNLTQYIRKCGLSRENTECPKVHCSATRAKTHIPFFRKIRVNM